MSRDEGWRYDLGILSREVHRKGFNPNLYVHRAVAREQFDAKVRELHDSIPNLSDQHIILAMMRMMVFLGDATPRCGIMAKTRSSARPCPCGSTGSKKASS
jgi:hypothetical protein